MKKQVMNYSFGYVRVSTGEQTVLNQKLAIAKWANDNDYEILDFLKIQRQVARYQRLIDLHLEKC
jgi:DNA invertase Pin-like site-specific DNA recombinase